MLSLTSTWTCFPFFDLPLFDLRPLFRPDFRLPDLRELNLDLRLLDLRLPDLRLADLRLPDLRDLRLDLREREPLVRDLTPDREPRVEPRLLLPLPLLFLLPEQQQQ